MKCIIRWIVISLAFVFFYACVSVPIAPQAESEKAKKFIPLPDKATIYIYRKDQFLGGGINFPIIVNGKIVSFLIVGTFVVVEANPGQIELSSFVHEKYTAKSIEVDAGKLYFFFAKVLDGVIFEVVDAETGMKDIRDLALTGRKSQ